MSVSDATLFYSRFDKKSSDMRQIISSLNIDMEFVPVDNRQVKELLMKDTRCNIDEVPAIVITYTDGGHKTFIGRRLDDWFQQLLENYQAQTAPPEPPAYTSIEQPAQPVQPVQVEGFDSQHTSIIDQPIGSGMGGGSAIQTAITSEHIVGAGSDIQPEPPAPSTRKEVKKEGMSAAEIAAQMAKAREEYEEQNNKNPLIQV